MLKYCEFCKCLSDRLLKDRIVLGITDAKTREKLLNERPLTLNKCLDICRSVESASEQMKTYEATVHKVSTEKTKSFSSSKTKAKSSYGDPKTIEKCKFCSGKHAWKKDACPAWGKSCSQCRKKNHLSKCCRNAKVHGVEANGSDSDSSIESISTVNVFAVGCIFTEMLINKKSVKFQIDSGAIVNVLPKSYVCEADIVPINITLRMYNSLLLVRPKSV